MNLLETMLNDNSFDYAKIGKIVYLDIDDIIPNPLNIAPIIDIDILAENISEGGLMQPLLITRKDNKNYIHSGHRRFEAIKQVLNKFGFIKYMGKQIEEVPVIYVNEKYESELEEKVSMMRSNSYRINLDSKEKSKLVLEALDCFEKLRELNKVSGRAREWIASITGISERTIQDIISKNKEESNGLIENEFQEIKCGKLPHGENYENKKAKKIINLMKKLSEELGKELDNKLLSEKVRTDLSKAKLNLMDDLMKLNR
ncbi:MAG: ParB/RepB/Spo0J family partition protein [Erysipelotrichaceae bacterium]|nr:ParB/RepB/Spo0J family partition protein [Erysipelotrichaceae bacterium]